MESRRMATEEEIRIYRIVNKYIEALPDDEYSKVCSKIGEYVFEWRKEERRRAYKRIYPLAVKIGVFVSDLETWYCMDEI